MTKGQDDEPHVSKDAFTEFDKRIEEHFDVVEAQLSALNIKVAAQNGSVRNLNEWRQQMTGRTQVLVFLLGVFGATVLALNWDAIASEHATSTDINCADVSRDVAQAILDADPRDPFRLDGDGDGRACEGRP